jgi:hypothetical protein
LADAADLDATSVRGLERDVANPTWDVADRVSRPLGIATVVAQVSDADLSHTTECITRDTASVIRASAVGPTKAEYFTI